MPNPRMDSEKGTKLFLLLKCKNLMLDLSLNLIQLNFIELIQALVKTCAAPKNNILKTKQLKEITFKPLSDLKINNWRNAGKHNKKVEEKF